MASALDARTLTLLLLAPVLEELAFRTGLQEALLRREASRRQSTLTLPSNLVTALCFSAIHIAVRPGLSSVLTVLPALVIGARYERQRRVAPCIVLHATFNGFWLLLTVA